MIIIQLNDRQLQKAIDSIERLTQANTNLTAAILSLNSQEEVSQELYDAIKSSKEKLDDVVDPQP